MLSIVIIVVIIVIIVVMLLLGLVESGLVASRIACMGNFGTAVAVVVAVAVVGAVVVLLLCPDAPDVACARIQVAMLKAARGHAPRIAGDACGVGAAGDAMRVLRRWYNNMHNNIKYIIL